MGSDRARVSYNPRQQYRSVVMQQGRVTLEADWNEAQLLASEELRREALDFVGPTGTPDNGYAISLISGSYDFNIGDGSMYVGGVRAYLADGLKYSQQPQNEWLDAPNDSTWVAVPTTAPTSDEYVYLLLREQEVSAVEDSDLKDVALGGPDTAQRTRLVQHVLRHATTGTDCPSALADAQKNWWPSSGFTLDTNHMRVSSFARLQVGFVPASSPASPCDPTAQSGYLGADNQLIRVQVSDPKADPQCLLWGYDDASFLYAVTVTSPTSVTLQSAPVDAEHIPQTGQTVEILMAAAQLSNGQYAAAPTGQIFILGASAYDPDTRILTLPSALTASLYGDGTSKNPSPAQVYLRVWQGQLPITPGTPQVLTNTGVQVTLTNTTNQQFRGGDYWMFAVRPAIANLVYPERYSSGPQPPDGPREWICPLAVILWTASTPTAVSCRNPFDNLVELTAGDQGGCCSVYVTAAGHNQGTFTIQDAINQILGTGGRVCLGPGAFNLTTTVAISGAAFPIEIAGMGATALFQSGSGVTTLNVATPASPQTASVAAILIDSSEGVTIQDLELNFAPGYVSPTGVNATTGAPTASVANPGIMIQNSSTVTVQRCTFTCTGNQYPANPAIAIGGLAYQTTIQDNIILFNLSDNAATPALGAGYGVTNLPVLGSQTAADTLTCVTFDLYVRNNILQNVTFAIELDATCYHLGQVEICGNFIGPSAAGVVIAGNGLPLLFTRVEISNNQIVESYAGIACGITARIANNDLTLMPVATPSGTDTTIGGIVISDPVLAGVLIDGLQILGNRISGGSGFGILIEAQLASAAIANNVLESTACGGIYAMAGAAHLSITNNQLLSLAPNSSDPGVGAMSGAYGILLGPTVADGVVQQAGYVEILGNIIKDFATDSTQQTVGSASRYAIAVQGYNSTLIANNHLINIGPAADTVDFSAGIYAASYPFDRLDIADNVIRRNDSTTTGDTGTEWYGVFISGFKLRRIIRASGTTTEALYQRVIPTGDSAAIGVSQIGGVEVAVGGLQNVNLDGNYIEAAGSASAVDIYVDGNCIVTGNQCSLATSGSTPVAALDAVSVVASSNVLSSTGKGSAGLTITTTSTINTNNFTVLGNISSGSILANNAALSATLQALNVIG